MELESTVHTQLISSLLLKVLWVSWLLSAIGVVWEMCQVVPKQSFHAELHTIWTQYCHKIGYVAKSASKLRQMIFVLGFISTERCSSRPGFLSTESGSAPNYCLFEHKKGQCRHQRCCTLVRKCSSARIPSSLHLHQDSFMLPWSRRNEHLLCGRVSLPR